MSTSEITAYLLGADIRRAQICPEAARIDLGRPLAESMTPEEMAAWVRLGDERFGYWLIRGANQAAEWPA